MNIIPSIFNERQINRTVIGGSENPSKILMPVTCLILGKNGSQYRERVLENVINFGFESIVCVERDSNGIQLETLSRKYPCVHFVCSQEKLTLGDMVNLGMAEAKSSYVLVVSDDLCMEHFNFTPAVAKKLIAQKNYCIVPRLTSSKLEILPVHFMPSASHSMFEVASSLVSTEGNATLYPFDMTGFYDRKKYISLGGADYTITSPYWQNLDLSMRAWLWGEKITITHLFQLCYANDIPEENQTADLSYLRFYLKNLLPVFVSDHAKIPFTSYFAFSVRSKCGITSSLRQFKDARRWVKQNQYRFRKDTANLIENWRDKR